MSNQLTDYWLAMTAIAGDASQLSPQQLDDLMQKVQLTVSHLQGFENLAKSLDAECVKRLGHP